VRICRAAKTGDIQLSADLGQMLYERAMSHPDVEEGIACAGTAAERKTVKIRKKAFLFLGTVNVMVKLGDSLPEAMQLASKEPNTYKAGAGGWVTISLECLSSSAVKRLLKWIDESYRLFAPKQRTAATPQQKSRPATKQRK
jgi:hypothetical protein